MFVTRAYVRCSCVCSLLVRMFVTRAYFLTPYFLWHDSLESCLSYLRIPPLEYLFFKLVLMVSMVVDTLYTCCTVDIVCIRAYEKSIWSISDYVSSCISVSCAAVGKVLVRTFSVCIIIIERIVYASMTTIHIQIHIHTKK